MMKGLRMDMTEVAPAVDGGGAGGRRRCAGGNRRRRFVDNWFVIVSGQRSTKQPEVELFQYYPLRFDTICNLTLYPMLTSEVMCLPTTLKTDQTIYEIRL
ncbi:hypothetical protein L1987_79183 [Smallanthus sonchifolius]|uniref:Uncharacterized protein n=1 Tax=Smallanthus sonchifolius TaxID=185202 RepID=A0ACB8ZF07_9ASTR|nr:hypothetical protein L1987_79183 [Smallanthus sonchifolius]